MKPAALPPAITVALVAVWTTASEPGVSAVLAFPTLLLSLVAVGRFVRAVTADRNHIRGRRNFLTTLAVFALLVVAPALDVPLSLRFALARPALDSAVERIQAPASPAEEDLVELPPVIGTYLASHARRTTSGVLFYDRIGSSFVDDAGFAYLPHGPTPDLEGPSFESPEFVHLGGPWYRWTASW